MQPQRNQNWVPRMEQIKASSAPGQYSLSADERLSVMEALDHLYVSRQYEAMGCCHVCKKISVRKCSGSGCKVLYCSIECQTIDWPKHRLLCTSERDNLSERGSNASLRFRDSSSLKGFNEGSLFITDRGSPFTALTNQLKKKSGNVLPDSKSVGNFKIANKQYRSRDTRSKSVLGLNNGAKDQKKSNSNERKKSFSPIKSVSSKKSSPDEKRSTGSSKKSNSNNRSFGNGKLLRSIENIPDKKTSSNEKTPSDVMKIGKTEVVAMYRESADRYWVIPVSSLRNYDEIQATLNRECTSYESTSPKMGLVYGCSFADEWFRGRIVKLSPETIVHFIDYGNFSNYDSKVFKKLPDNLQSLPGLVFQIEFEEGTPLQYKTEDIESQKFVIEETKKTSDGVALVKVIEGPYGPTEKPLKLSKVPDKKRVTQASHNRKCVMDSISANSNGMLFFVPGEGDIRYASIVPDNNKEANDSIEKLLSVDNSNASTCRAVPGDYVLVPDKEGNFLRGKVVLRLGLTYYVHLIDCGDVILSENVYPLLEDLVELTEVGVKITVQEVVSPQQLKEVETCFFAVTGEAVAGKWPCTIKGTQQQIIAHVLLEKVTVNINWKPRAVFLKSGGTVEISSKHSPNSVYVRCVDAEVEQKFLDMNMEVIQFASKAKNFESPPTVGELCCAKFKDDGCFYRAVVNSVHSRKVSVMFVDFGNEQETDLEDVKPLPETLKNIPIFAIKVEMKNVSRKPWNNMIEDYIGKLMTDNVELTMTFSENIHAGVILTEKVTGVVVNDFIEKARDKSAASSVHSDRSLSKKEIFLDDDMEYTKFPSGRTFTLAILYVWEVDFKSCQTFWATVADKENFNYVNVELSSLISDHCDSVTTPYEPTYRELCLAEFEGCWYRAICMGRASENLYKVFFVDFGNCCNVKAVSIRKMEKQFLNGPALAVNCTISGRDRLKGNPELTDKVFQKLNDRINTFIEGVTAIKFEEDTFTLNIPEIEAMLI